MRIEKVSSRQSYARLSGASDSTDTARLTWAATGPTRIARLSGAAMGTDAAERVDWRIG